jgi:hypothetical protein
VRQRPSWRIDDGPIEHPPVGDQAQIEAVAQLAPQPGLALGGRQGGLEQPAAALLDLIDQKRQHHQVHEHGAEVLVAVTEVVLEVIALVLEGVEGLVFDLPAGAGSSHQGHPVAVVDGEIGHPREVLDTAVGGVLPILEEVHLEVEVGVVQRHAVEVTEAGGGIRSCRRSSLRWCARWPRHSRTRTYDRSAWHRE